MTTDIQVPDLAEALKTAAYVREVLTAQGLKFTGGPSVHAVEKLSFKGSMYELLVDIYCGSNYVTVKASLPVLVPDSALDAVLRELNERSCAHPYGGFEFNTVSGKVVFKSAVSVPPLPTGDYLHQMVMWSVAEVDGFAPRLDEMLKNASSSGAASRDRRS